MLTQAVILCGGLGTRLGELTATTPKPMLPVAGTPFIEHLIREVSRHGFEKITLLAGRFGEQLWDAYHDMRIGASRVEVLIEPAPMGTAGALVFAEQALDPTFLLMNGDSWIDMNLRSFRKHWLAMRNQENPVQVQMLLQTVPDAARFGQVTVTSDRVTVFHEKDDSHAAGLINAGVYILDRSIIDRIPRGRAVSIEQEIFPGLAQAGCIAGMVAPQGAYFIDIGLPVTYSQVQEDFRNQLHRPALFLDRDGTLNVDAGYTHNPYHLVWQPQAREAIAMANQQGCYVFVVTNQSGIGRGFYGEADLLAFHRKMQSELDEVDAWIDGIIWCPHLPEVGCNCRKPAAGMLNKLCDFWPILRDRSVMIGDRDSDMAAARSAGIAGVLYQGGSLLDVVARALEKDPKDVDQ